MLKVSIKKGALSERFLECVFEGLISNMGLFPWFHDVDVPSGYNELQCTSEKVARALIEGKEIIVHSYNDYSDEKPTARKLTIRDFEKGVRRLARKQQEYFIEILQENMDAWTCDAVMQCTIYGDIEFS